MKKLAHSIERRKFLRGIGISLALPALESLAAPATRLQGEAVREDGLPGMAVTESGSPLRMAFVYVPNGANMKKWRPVGTGDQFQLGQSLSPLCSFRNQLQVISGLGHENGTAGRDGAGDHARAGASFLTGARPLKTAGADIRVGISVDQLAAQHIGNVTRFRSLEISCDAARKSGNCDSGYSCAYQYNLAWRSPTIPVAPEANPRLVFERLFGAGGRETREQSLVARRALKRSILDFVREDTGRLARSVSHEDRTKLEEYLTSVRELEQQIEHVERLGAASDPDMALPEGIPDDYRAHIRLMFDLLAVAFQTDSTRIATFLLAHDGSGRSFPDIGVKEGHHYLSHHGNDQEKLEKIARIDEFYAEQFAYFLDRLNGMRDFDGASLLDNSMIVYGYGLADGNRHAHTNLPVILAGRGGGALNPGRHLEHTSPTPMSNLYVSMLGHMGVAVDQFSDSNGAVMA